jgi:hypothetical protein
MTTIDADGVLAGRDGEGRAPTLPPADLEELIRSAIPEEISEPERLKATFADVLDEFAPPADDRPAAIKWSSEFSLVRRDWASNRSSRSPRNRGEHRPTARRRLERIAVGVRRLLGVLDEQFGPSPGEGEEE